MHIESASLNRGNKALLLLTMFLLLLLAGCFGSNPIDKEGKTTIFNDLYEFQDALAKKVQERFVPANAPRNFTVAVGVADYPIGTLLVSGTSIPVDDRNCVVIPEPEPLSADSLFPSYTIDSGTALAFGLDQEKFSSIVSFSTDAKYNKSVSYRIKEAKVQLVTNNALKEVIGKADCARATGGESVYIVRGYVLGKREFEIKGVRKLAMDTSFKKIGKFDVEIHNNDVLSVTDSQQTRFLAIVSEVNVAGATKSSSAYNANNIHTRFLILASNDYIIQQSATDAENQGGILVGSNNSGYHMAQSDQDHKPNEAAIDVDQISIQTPTPESQKQSFIYIQKDADDQSDTATTLRNVLKDSSYRVARHIQPIESKKMPETAEIRYFRTSDRAEAEKVLNLVKDKYPNAVTAPVGLPAPSGQIEVWLPASDK